jgi:hypothetical protein
LLTKPESIRSTKSRIEANTVGESERGVTTPHDEGGVCRCYGDERDGLWPVLKRASVDQAYERLTEEENQVGDGRLR